MTDRRTIWQMTLAGFRDAVESRATPGCGAAAATAATTGMALVLKGMRIANAKRRDDRRDRLIARGDACVERLGAQADEDVAAFNAYLAAQKSGDDDALAQAIERINRVPLATARTCLSALGDMDDALALTQRNLQSDTRAGARLLHAGLSMVLLNVDANIDGLEDADERETLANQRAALQAEADAIVEKIAAPR